VPERLLSIRKICDQYGLSDKTIRRRIADGTLVAYRCGPRLIKLDADQVEAALIRPATEPNDTESAVARIISAAPQLSAEQLGRIAALLRAGGGDGLTSEAATA
jgi:excisionase family DNA binding protein